MGMDFNRNSHFRDIHVYVYYLFYLKAFFLSTELVSLPTGDNLLGTQVLEQVVTRVTKSAEVWVRSGAQTKHSIPKITKTISETNLPLHKPCHVVKHVYCITHIKHSAAAS